MRTLIFQSRIKFVILDSMIKTYDGPTCFETKKNALHYCCSENCTLPAFGCSEECLEEHAGHDIRPWHTMEQLINKQTHTALNFSEIKMLEQQEKQILMMIEELKTIQINHEKSMRKIKSLLTIRESAAKILTSIKSKTTDSLTGLDMAELLKLISSNSIFSNANIVAEALQNRTQHINNTLKNLSQTIQSHNNSLIRLTMLEDVPPRDEMQIDLKSIREELIVENDRILTIRPGFPKYYPIFFNQSLSDKQKFQIEVIDVGDRSFTIGVSTNRLRKQVDGQKDNGSICVHANGVLYADGYREEYSFKIKNLDRITVERSKDRILFFINNKQICRTRISSDTTEMKLYPTCWIRGNFSPSSIAKLRYL